MTVERNFPSGKSIAKRGAALVVSGVLAVPVGNILLDHSTVYRHQTNLDQGERSGAIQGADTPSTTVHTSEAPAAKEIEVTPTTVAAGQIPTD